MHRIIVVAPHPDDETLGCGGTLLRHKAEGDEIYWLIMTRMHQDSGYDVDRIKLRQKEIESVQNAYGFTSVYQAPFSSARLDLVPQQDFK